MSKSQKANTPGMISQETAGRIWNAYREIQMGEKLLADMAAALKEGRDPNPRDAFGRQRNLTLGVPSGDHSERMLDVAPRLAIAVINGHIAEKKLELAQANEAARIELETVS